MSLRARYLVAGIVAIAAVAVVVVVLRSGGDSPEGEIRQGRTGFPLRGSLARDDEAIAGAVKAWRAGDKQEDEEDEDDEAPDKFGGLRPDADDPVTVLWAGRVAGDDREVAVLDNGELAAEVLRRPDGGWFVDGETLLDLNRTPEVPVLAGESIVVPAASHWSAVRTHASAPDAAGDGLFRTDGFDTEGFVIPDEPAGSRFPVGLYAVGVGGLTMSEDGLADFKDAVEAGNGRALYNAVSAARAPLTEMIERNSGRSRDLEKPQPIEVVWTGQVPDGPRAAIVAQGRGATQALAVGYGEVPSDDAGSEVNRDTDPDGSGELLGFGRPPLSGRRDVDAFVAGSYVEVDHLPYLVLAGRGVESLHALVGDREISRRGPAAVIDARAFGEVDTVVYGRTAKGTVAGALERP